MNSVREILAQKGHQVYTISQAAFVFDALKLLSEKNIGALLVTDGDDVVGILSERDYARKVILENKSSKNLTVKEIMSTDVVFVNQSVSPEECMALMTNKKIRHLPVFENKKLSGIISIGDVVKAVIDQKEFLIDHLEEYINLRR
jgi:CBS domain-containing protein